MLPDFFAIDVQHRGHAFAVVVIDASRFAAEGLGAGVPRVEAIGNAATRFVVKVARGAVDAPGYTFQAHAVRSMANVVPLGLCAIGVVCNDRFGAFLIGDVVAQGQLAGRKIVLV